MRVGYLFLETHEDHPGLVRVMTDGDAPEPGADRGPGRIRYVARFTDIDTGRMHLHQLLRRKLVNVGAGLYRVDLADAIAAAEAIDLLHTRQWLDPDLGPEVLRRVEEDANRLRRRHRLRDRLWRFVGGCAIAVLILNLLRAF